MEFPLPVVAGLNYYDQSNEFETAQNFKNNASIRSECQVYIAIGIKGVYDVDDDGTFF